MDLKLQRLLGSQLSLSTSIKIQGFLLATLPFAALLDVLSHFRFLDSLPSHYSLQNARPRGGDRTEQD
jgi:hypothetical protein